MSRSSARPLGGGGLSWRRSAVPIVARQEIGAGSEWTGLIFSPFGLPPSRCARCSAAAIRLMADPGQVGTRLGAAASCGA